ncbi:MAG TPA: hypothetical protein ENN43_03390 [bacterium]|nr:hypothetical protein [bacterium]
MRENDKGSLLKAFFAVILIISLFFAARASYMQDASWEHMAKGKEIMRDMGLPKADTSSFTEKAGWDRSSWLYDVFIYSFASIVGAENLYFLKFFLMLFCFFTLYLVVYKRQQGKYISITLPFSIAAVFLMERWFTAGPAAFSILFIAFFLYVLERKPSKRNRQLYFSLPLITLLWANMHYSAAIGPAMIFFYAIYRAIDVFESPEKREAYDFRLIGLSLLFSSAACLLSPSLLEAPAAFYRELTTPGWFNGISFGGETGLYHTLFFAYSAVMFIIILYDLKGADVGRRGEFIKDAMIAIFFFGAALKDSSNIPWFLAASVPVLSYYVYLVFRWDFVWKRQWTEADLLRVKNPVYVFLAVFTVIFTGMRFMAPADYAPAGQALRFIRNTTVPENILSNPAYNGMARHVLRPNYRTAGRGAEAVKLYNAVYNAEEGFDAAIENHKVRSFLLEDGAPSRDVLMKMGYKPAYFDGKYILLVTPAPVARYFKYVNPFEEKGYDLANHGSAVAELEEFAEKYPSEAAQLLLASLIADRNKPAAVDYLGEMLEKYPLHYGLYHKRAAFNLEAGDYENALDDLLRSKARGENEERMIREIRAHIKRRSAE